MSNIIRRGKFFGLFCSKPDWVYVYDNDWAMYGTTFYRWCKECDRFERVGFISHGRLQDTPELWDEMELPPPGELIPYIAGPNENDYFRLRTIAGFGKD